MDEGAMGLRQGWAVLGGEALSLVWALRQSSPERSGLDQAWTFQSLFFRFILVSLILQRVRLVDGGTVMNGSH